LLHSAKIKTKNNEKPENLKTQGIYAHGAFSSPVYRRNSNSPGTAEFNAPNLQSQSNLGPTSALAFVHFGEELLPPPFKIF